MPTTMPLITPTMNLEEIQEIVARLSDENAHLKSNQSFGLSWENSLDEKALMLQSCVPLLKEDLSRYVKTNVASPTHLLIKGDNLHALTALHSTYAGKVDVIYIDPPYNTGNKDFIYNDSYVDAKDSYRHSRWLSFMKPRLEIAQQMLSENGVILVSIDDNEQPRLRLLMDSIFGENNFIANLIWQGSPSSLAKFTSGGIDYILAYGKNVNKLSKWKLEKPYAKEMVSLVEKSMTANNVEETTKKLRAFILKNKSQMDVGLTGYNRVDEQGRIYSDAGLVNSLSRPNLKYPITDPKTGQVYEPHDNGWKLSPETMGKLIDDDLVLFEGRKYPRKKLLLVDYLYSLPRQSFKAERSKGSSVLNNILGKNKFHFPKNVDVIKEWIGIVSDNKDAIIMDFFAGSGSTAHAVAELNADDGGNRKCILVTDGGKTELEGDSAKNKRGEIIDIAEEVTYERVKRVLTGKGWADGKEHLELGGNMRYYTVDLLSWEDVNSLGTEPNEYTFTGQQVQSHTLFHNMSLGKDNSDYLNRILSSRETILRDILSL